MSRIVYHSRYIHKLFIKITTLGIKIHRMTTVYPSLFIWFLGARYTVHYYVSTYIVTPCDLPDHVY